MRLPARPCRSSGTGGACSPRRPRHGRGRALRSSGPGRTRGADWPGRAVRSGGTLCSVCALWALRASRSRRALRPCLPVSSAGSGGACGSGRSGCACGALCPSSSISSGRTCGAGWPGRAVFALKAYQTLRPGRACGSRFPLQALRPLRAGRPSRAGRAVFACRALWACRSSGASGAGFAGGALSSICAVGACGPCRTCRACRAGDSRFCAGRPGGARWALSALQRAVIDPPGAAAHGGVGIYVIRCARADIVVIAYVWAGHALLERLEAGILAEDIEAGSPVALRACRSCGAREAGFALAPLRSLCSCGSGWAGRARRAFRARHI